MSESLLLMIVGGSLTVASLGMLYAIYDLERRYQAKDEKRERVVEGRFPRRARR